MKKIIVDVMSGDNDPLDTVRGGYLAVDEIDDIEVILVGNEKIITEILKNEHPNMDRIKIVNADDVLTMDDDPACIRERKNSSMHIAIKLLADGDGDGVVSAGNTGAYITGSTLIVKRISGVKRAALTPVMPTKTGSTILVDGGANVDCLPEYLLQFGIMGSIYMNRIYGIDKPRVALLNNGTEEKKGGLLQRDAYSLLQKAGDDGIINFIGNVEAKSVLYGATDVVVCDGLSGNILLKASEGVAMFLMDSLRDIFMESMLSKLSAAIIKPGLRELKKKLDYNEVGGAVLLGISKPIIKAHGSSGKVAIKNAIRQAKICCDSEIIKYIEDDISKIEKICD